MPDPLPGAEVDQAPRDPGQDGAQRTVLAAQSRAAPLQLLEAIRLPDVAEVVDVFQSGSRSRTRLDDRTDAVEHAEATSLDVPNLDE